MSETTETKTENLEELIKIFEQKTNLNFPDFYNKYLNKLIYYNYKICKDLQQAEDLAQDALLKALSVIDTYDATKSKFSTWLFAISKNDSLQELKNKRIMVSVDQYIDDEGSTLLDYMHDDEDGRKEELKIKDLNHEKGRLLREYIPKLKYPYRNVLEMREIQKFSYRKISILLQEDNKTIFDLSKANFKIHKNTEYIDLDLVDNEIKKDDEIGKFCSITDILDMNGDSIKYDILEYDKDELISKIRLHLKHNDKFIIYGTSPFNLSTLKSRIRGGRNILQKMVKKDFKKLDYKYLS